jgi:hypothetical protein
MNKALFWCAVLVIALTGCKTQKMICPAYQSAFIFDKPTAREAFVHYNEDKSQPRELLASNSKTLTLPPRDSSWENSVVLPGPSLPKEKRNKRTRYLLLPEKTYRKALRALQTVEMKPVYPVKKKDSLNGNIAKLLDSAARSINDTLTSTDKIASTKPESKEDSVYVISLEKEKFNVDQDNYMWYFRNILVLPDVRIAMEGAKEDAKTTAKKEKKKGFFGFFKNLFGKKEKKKKDSVKVDTKLQNQPTDSTAVISPSPEAPKKKKGIFGLFKKKSKADDKPPAPAKKEEEEKF